MPMYGEEEVVEVTEVVYEEPVVEEEVVEVVEEVHYDWEPWACHHVDSVSMK